MLWSSKYKLLPPCHLDISIHKFANSLHTFFFPHISENRLCHIMDAMRVLLSSVIGSILFSLLVRATGHTMMMCLVIAASWTQWNIGTDIVSLAHWLDLLYDITPGWKLVSYTPGQTTEGPTPTHVRYLALGLAASSRQMRTTAFFDMNYLTMCSRCWYGPYGTVSLSSCSQALLFSRGVPLALRTHPTQGSMGGYNYLPPWVGGSSGPEVKKAQLLCLKAGNASAPELPLG